jgi:hypothetical protein
MMEETMDLQGRAALMISYVGATFRRPSKSVVMSGFSRTWWCCAFIFVLPILVLATAAQAQVISGSTGADGAFYFIDFHEAQSLPPGTTASCIDAQGFPELPCTLTVPLREPPNHVLNFTTVTIGPQVTVKFKRNRANTPVFILATGDVTINGTIDVSGENATTYPQGALGGPGGGSGGVDGAGLGIGGGTGGIGHPAFGCFAGCYGTPELQPLIGGSGGGESALGVHMLGGGGGGAVLVAASGTVDLGNGSGPALVASGGVGKQDSISDLETSGSGGAIRLVGNVVSGQRSIVAESPWLKASPTDVVTNGRIRIEAPPGGLQYTGNAAPSASLGAPGVILPLVMPGLRIVSVGGSTVPSTPVRDLAATDVTLSPSSTAFTLVEARHLPSDAVIEIRLVRELAQGSIFKSLTSQPAGPPVPCPGEPAEAVCLIFSYSVSLPQTGVGVISAYTLGNVMPVP